jgi:hypothetical protein
MDEKTFARKEFLDAYELAKDLYDQPLEDPTRLEALVVSLEAEPVFRIAEKSKTEP